MEKKIYTLEDFYFDLPEELISQYPLEKRDSSRLFVLDRKKSEFHHKNFTDLLKFINDGDVLVFNNAKVIPARIYFRRETGASVEIVLTRKTTKGWLAISNRTARLKTGEILKSEADPEITIKISGRHDEFIILEEITELSDDILKKIGSIPLPPYISRKPESIDEKRYQTIYAEKNGAVAAPTAGLHFTEEIMDGITHIGAKKANLTLHVSWGTFSPVRESDISLHKMHSENYELDDETAETINQARENKKRVIAVGTTSLRVLESTYKDGKNYPAVGETNIFLYPPRKIQSADALITNFHTPGSTLLMLVSAFASHELIMEAYREAVSRKYRFFSYGDSMMII